MKKLQCSLVPFISALSVLTACGGGISPQQSQTSSKKHGTGAQSAGNATNADAGASDSQNGSQSSSDSTSATGNGTDGSNQAANCQTQCADDDCGAVPDGCGNFLTCNPCAPGLVCGLNAPNKCGVPKSVNCTPLTAAQVCSGKCGAVSDGCSGVVTCDDQNGGVTCSGNQFCSASACVTGGNSSCTAATCSSKADECGVDGDGCGGSLSCGDCAAGLQCAYASTGNHCVPIVPSTCTPLTAAAACAGTCGIVSDGCSGQIDCQADPSTACPQGQSCGGGGTPGQCGMGQTCMPLAETTVCAGKCGSQSDGCSGAYQCSDANGGQTCDTAAGQSCGGGGVANVCGTGGCTALTQAQACPGSNGNKSCGQQPDGCGGLIDCGGCAQDQMCGLNEASICGTIPSCQQIPATTACAGKCGMVPDGCGGIYTCDGSNGGVVCTGSEYCGANNMPNHCGTPAQSCSPKTCADLGHTCGLASDGCGHILNCWPSCNGNVNCTGSCPNSGVCIADATTGAQGCVAGAPSCSGSLCGSLPTSCAASSPTRLTGTVLTPGRVVNGVTLNQLPVPNALVYIPADPATALPDIAEGVQIGNSASCGRCADEKLVADGESVLAAAVTDFKGAFTLEGRVPVGTAFKLVVKVGKWRRVAQVPSGTAVACSTQALALDYTRLAANSTDGLSGTHLPKIAVSTGDVDAMECVLRGIGISDSEFTVPSGTGRIQMYRANGTRMGPATCNGTYTKHGVATSCAASNNAGCVQAKSGCSWNDTSVADTVLYASQDAIDAYDMVVFDCEGNGHYIRSSGPLGYVLAYANNGGRVFASHWSYEWLDNNGTLDTAAAWNSNGGGDTSATAYVSLPTGPTARTGANPVKSLLYRDWLDWQGALTGTTAGQLDNPTTPQLAITDPRDVAGGSVGTSSDEWLYRINATPMVQQLSFNTPYGYAEDQICGRVAFSGFHVAATTAGTTLSTSNIFWPTECNDAELTPQEKTLAFMLFDLGTCVSAGDPPTPPSCTPKTVANTCPGANDACGYVSDGCGGVVDCGGCGSGFYCDGNTCRPQQCTPWTCASLGFTCGSFADGCGGIARNAQGQEGCGTCSGGQTCGLYSPGICGGCVQVAQATACPTNSCGLVSDGCGGTYDCGACQTGVCGGGGANRCGSGACSQIDQATACANKNCGLVSDGCGGTYSCGTCTGSATCGGTGAPNICGSPLCTPKTTQQACNGLSCGWVSDGCGGAINCGTCPNGGVCGGAGPNQCGSSCTPTTCSAAGAECGFIADQCGALLSCGGCPSGQTCGASAPNKCGGGPSCTPRSCSDAGAQCGLVGDGCGGVLDCGGCTAPATCGGAGKANQCGTGTGGCSKFSCSTQNVLCGQASDGCGGLLDCGACPSGMYCMNGACQWAPVTIM